MREGVPILSMTLVREGTYSEHDFGERGCTYSEHEFGEKGYLF